MALSSFGALARRPKAAQLRGGRTSAGHPSGRGIECIVSPSPSSPRRAGVSYRDSEGALLDDVILRDDLDRYLAETRHLLRECGRPSFLHVRLADNWDDGPGCDVPPPVISVELTGTLPWGLRIKVGEEWFGRGCPYGWTAATLAIFSEWSPGDVGRIAVSRLALEGDGAERPLYRLYARSVALRRLATRAVAGGLT